MREVVRGELRVVLREVEGVREKQLRGMMEGTSSSLRSWTNARLD